MSLQILIISDDGSFTDELRRLIASAGHAAVVVPEGVEHFRAIGKHKPDLVLVAVEAAKVTSVAVEQRLHTSQGPRRVPVIVISECLRLEAELPHIFDFIPMPLDALRLFEDLATIEKRRLSAAEPAPLTEEQYRQFCEHILSCTGLHFESRNRSALERGVRKRMSALLMDSCTEYLWHLKRHGESRHELQKLVQFLTVGETYFFRYPAQFEALKERLLAQAHLGRPIRIWSAGCSTGEEPYSIAISIMEALPDWRKRDVRIIATDINNQSLRMAREGVYSPWSIRSTDRNRLERYFTRIGESFVIRDEVKELVEFRHLNLTDPGVARLLAEVGSLDAIFCRNVLIYFSLETAAALVAQFAAALRVSGQLFLGHAETVLQRSRELEVRRLQSSFFYVRTDALPETQPGVRADAVQAPRPVPVRQPLSQPAPLSPAQDLERAAPAPRMETARQLFDAEDLNGALTVLEALLTEAPEQASALILKGFVLASQGRLVEALEACSRAIEINDLLPEAYFLKGILLDASGLLTEAADEYRKALLLDNDFIMPRYYMGRLHLRLGRVSEGAREIRNSIKLLARRGGEETIPYSGGLTRSVCMLQLQQALAQVA